MTDTFRDLSDLPKAKRSQDGEPPDKDSRFSEAFVQQWHEEGIERDFHFRDGESARFWHSSAGDCSRALAYMALDVPRSNAMDAPGHFIVRQGQNLHDAFQAHLQARFPDAAEIEVKVGRDDRGGHVDAVVNLETGTARPHVVAIELKSIGGYAYKLAVGDRGPAQGPKYEHKIQVALNAYEVDADEAVIVYLARDAISVQQAQRKGISDIQRVTAEWTYTREQYRPLAEKEIERVTRILQMLGEGTLPKRAIPDPELPLNHVITNPTKGEWMVFDHDDHLVDAGTTWRCLYCGYQDTCALTGPHRESVDVLVQIGVLGQEAGDVAKVSKDSQPVVETDEEGKRHVKVVDETGETEVLEGDPQDVHRVVVEIDRELNREDQQP